MTLTVGIDLGTSGTSVAAFVDGKVMVSPGANGTGTLPSVVCFTPSGRILVGDDARRAHPLHPSRTFWSFKDLLGAVRDRQVVDGHHLLPEDLAALIVTRAIEEAGDFFGSKVSQAVIMVPVGAGLLQRSATRRAVEAAGVEVLRILREPVAAALAIDHGMAEEVRGLLVFDLGGGTLDVTLLECSEGVYHIKGIAADVQLGGDTFDLALLDDLTSRFFRDTNVDLRLDASALARMKAAAEMAKRDLSAAETTSVVLPAIAYASGDRFDLEYELTRRDLETLTGTLVDSATLVAHGALKRLETDLKFSRDEFELNGIVLVGGASRMPSVRNSLTRQFDVPLLSSLDPNHIVVRGAALQAAILKGLVADRLLLDTATTGIGLGSAPSNEETILGWGTTIPTKVTKDVTFDAGLGAVPIVALGPDGSAQEMIGCIETPGRESPTDYQVSVDIDGNARTHVTVVNPATGWTQTLELGDDSHDRAAELIPDPHELRGSEAVDPFVFVSYSSGNRKYVTELCQHLESAGIASWSDSSTASGQEWVDQIEGRLRTCSAVIIVLSSTGMSKWMTREYLLADSLSKPVLPLRLADVCPFPLLSLQHTDVLDGGMPSTDFTFAVKQWL